MSINFHRPLLPITFFQYLNEQTKSQFILFSYPILDKFKMIKSQNQGRIYRGIRRVRGTMLTEIVRIEGRKISQNRPHLKLSSAIFLLDRKGSRDNRNTYMGFRLGSL